MKKYRVIVAVFALLLGFSTLAHAGSNSPPQANFDATTRGAEFATQLGNLPPQAPVQALNTGKIGACVWLIINGLAQCMIGADADTAGNGAGTIVQAIIH